MKPNADLLGKAPMVPFYFTATLAGITIIGDIWAYAATGTRGAVTTVFLCFLPVAFLMLGQQMIMLGKEVASLRDKVAKLQPPSN